MKVRELIAELQKLDQDKDIWVHDDCSFGYVPEVSVADAYTTDLNRNIKQGDYVL